jgi:hypothetical protein
VYGLPAPSRVALPAAVKTTLVPSDMANPPGHATVVVPVPAAFGTVIVNAPGRNHAPGGTTAPAPNATAAENLPSVIEPGE